MRISSNLIPGVFGLAVLALSLGETHASGWSGRSVSHPDGSASFLGRYPVDLKSPPHVWARTFVATTAGRVAAFRLDRTEPIRDGQVYELAQVLGGLRVRGGFIRLVVRDEAIVHARFEIRPVSSVAAADASTPPRVDARTAPRIAERSLGVADPERPSPPAVELEWVRTASGDLRRAWRSEVVRALPPDRWWLWIDAETRQVIRRERRSTDVEGTVNMSVDADCQDQGTEMRPVPHIEWAPGRFADAEGAFRTADDVRESEIALASPYFSLRNRAGEVAGPWRFPLAAAPAVNELSISPPLDQATPFYHAHFVRDWMRSRLDLDGGSQKRWSESQVVLNVNTPQTCNATYNGQINFFRAGNGCTNTGRVSTIVYHEYGHGIHDNSSNTFDGQVSEGIADFTAATIRNSPSITGIRGCNAEFRSCDNDLTYCRSGCDHGPGSQVHASGQVICAVWWELRQALTERYGYDEGVKVTDQLFLDFLTAVTSMTSAYEATIAVDEDDDGDPSNGTRHSCEINRAFANTEPGTTAHFPELVGRIPDAPSVIIEHDPPGVVDPSGPRTLRFGVRVEPGCAPATESPRITAVFTAPDGSERSLERPADPSEQYAFDLSSLEVGVPYRYYLRVELGGVTSYYPNQARTNFLRQASPDNFPPYRQGLFIGARATIWADDFETERDFLADACDRVGAASACQPGARSDWTWHDGSTSNAGGPAEAHSGRGMWVTNPDGTYARRRRSRLTLPPLDASAYGEVRLQFWRFLTSADVAAVEVNGRRVFDQRAGAFFWRDPAWTFMDLDISPWAAGQDQVEIQFVIDDEFNDTFELGGWHIDDLRVVGTAGSAPGEGAGGDAPPGPGPATRRPPSSGCRAGAGQPSATMWLIAAVVAWALRRRARRRAGLGRRRGPRSAALAGAAFASAAIAGSGCTDVGLCRYPCGEGRIAVHDRAVTMAGRFCTLDPTAVVYPYKILFVIDISGSNQGSDPGDDRARAVQEVIDTYIENRSVSFGAITFNDQSEAQTPGFTRNYELLVPDVVDTLTVKENGTNYLDTLALVHDFIEQDILAAPEGDRARTRYDIQWLSDGVPDPCQSPEPVKALARRLVELRDQYGLFDLVINTTQLTFPDRVVPPGNGCPGVVPGDDYLAPMAEIGEGQFQQLDGGSLGFTIGFDEIRRRWESRSFFVVNQSRQLWDDVLKPDSDADGVRDDDVEHEPDPLRSDANGDGCSDRVEEEILPSVGLCEDSCRVATSTRTAVDTDGDGLPDCAERVLGYFRTRIDSDLDGFSDGVELRFRTNPLDGNIFLEDADGDGVSDGEEIRQGTNPRWPEHPNARALFAYRYGSLEAAPSPATGVSCFDFRVDNVRLAETASTAESPRGENRLCVHVVQTTLDDPDAQPEIVVACRHARYWRQGRIDYLSPGTGVVDFAPGDFRSLAESAAEDRR